MDLPATSQPVQKSPQAGEPPEVQGSEGKGLTLLWNSCLSESYHLKNVGYTKDFFSLFCFHLSPSGHSPVGCFGPGTRAYVGRALCTQINTNATHIHMAHTYTQRYTFVQTCRDAQIHMWILTTDTQADSCTQIQTLDTGTHGHMHTSRGTGRPALPFCSFGFSDSWCEAHSTHTPHLHLARPCKAQLLLSARFTVDNSSFPL